MVPGASSAVVLTFEAAATAFASVFHALARGFDPLELLSLIEQI